MPDINQHVPDDRVSEVHFAEAGTFGDVGSCLGFAAHSSCECSERLFTLLLHANDLFSHHTGSYTTVTASDFMTAMTMEAGLLSMDGSVLSRLSPNSSPVHWKSYDD